MAPAKDELLTSIHNPLIQLTRSLLANRSARSENGLFITEGLRLGTEVVKSPCLPRYVLYAENLSSEGISIVNVYREKGVRITALSPELMERVSATETSQGILIALPIEPLPLPATADLALILDQLRDPGNLGTILRSAAAAGVKLVFLTPGSVDAYMPKVVRSAMGAHFRLGIHSVDWPTISEYCQKQCTPPLKILTAESGGGKSLWETDLKAPLALVIGGEAEGLGDYAKKISAGSVHIPMPGEFESLNAGVAASILLFEIIRQRHK